jgi:hypothetical protein
LCQTFSRLAVYELIILIEGFCQYLKNPAVPIFVIHNAAKIIYQRRQHHRLVAG